MRRHTIKRKSIEAVVGAVLRWREIDTLRVWPRPERRKFPPVAHMLTPSATATSSRSSRLRGPSTTWPRTRPAPTRPRLPPPISTRTWGRCRTTSTTPVRRDRWRSQTARRKATASTETGCRRPSERQLRGTGGRDMRPWKRWKSTDDARRYTPRGNGRKSPHPRTWWPVELTDRTPARWQSPPTNPWYFPSSEADDCVRHRSTWTYRVPVRRRTEWSGTRRETSGSERRNSARPGTILKSLPIVVCPSVARTSTIAGRGRLEIWPLICRAAHCCLTSFRLYSLLVHLLLPSTVPQSVFPPIL